MTRPALPVLLVVALVAGASLAACSDSDERAFGSSFGYVLDEVPEGYRLCGVSTPSGLSVRSAVTATLRVYGDSRVDDPYLAPIYGLATFEASDLGDLDLGSVTAVEMQGSTTALLGAADGFQLAELPAEAGRVLTWSAGGLVVQLMARNDDVTDLPDLATHVVVSSAGATIGAGGLAAEFVDMGDLYELEAGSGFRFSLDHRVGEVEQGSVGDQLTLLGAEGGPSELEAFRFRAVSSSRRMVGAAPGVVADMGFELGGPRVVSWIFDEGVILRLFSFALEFDDLVAVAHTARRAPGDEWGLLVEELGAGCGR